MENLTIEGKVLKTEMLLLDLIKTADLTAEEAEKVLTRLLFDVLLAISVASGEEFADLHARLWRSSFLVHLNKSNEGSK